MHRLVQEFVMIVIGASASRVYGVTNSCHSVGQQAICIAVAKYKLSCAYSDQHYGRKQPKIRDALEKCCS